MSIYFKNRRIVDTSGDIVPPGGTHKRSTVDLSLAAKSRRHIPTDPPNTINEHHSHSIVSVGMVQHIRTIVPSVINKQNKRNQIKETRLHKQKLRASPSQVTQLAAKSPACNQHVAIDVARKTPSKHVVIQEPHASNPLVLSQVNHTVKPIKSILASAVTDPPDTSNAAQKPLKHVHFAQSFSFVIGPFSRHGYINLHCIYIYGSTYK